MDKNLVYKLTYETIVDSLPDFTSSVETKSLSTI